MQAVNIRQLKSNPSVALREAKNDLVMVTNRGKPDALLVSMEQLSGIPNIEQVRMVLAISMFQNRDLSLAAAAKVAGKTLSDMLTIVSEMDIPVVDYSEEEADVEAVTLEKWLGDNSSGERQEPA